MKHLIIEELSGWKRWEVVWLVAECVVILALSIYWGDTVMGTISAITGVACVVCTGKGKLSAYLFGLINASLYGWIAFHAKYYGEVMLNWLYYVPMQFYGFYVWKKNMNPETHEVRKRKMTWKGRFLLTVVMVLITWLYGLVLKRMGGELPYMDALSTGISVVAIIISIKMYLEQWILWIIVDTVTVIMWAMAFAKGNSNIATLIMWSVYLANGVIMYLKWAKEIKMENAKTS
ncbi:MAG: nicotinamide mononucleotide transporter [Lachnospiraceae bacterium]|nr:nicotinamide mononucleotide transporter [Lachnospiraceae bacterium]